MKVIATQDEGSPYQSDRFIVIATRAELAKVAGITTMRDRDRIRVGTIIDINAAWDQIEKVRAMTGRIREAKLAIECASGALDMAAPLYTEIAKPLDD